MKFLISLASIVLCIGILALGGFLTYQQSDVGGMIDEIVAITTETPIFPGMGGNEETPDVPGEEVGGDEKPGPGTENPGQGGNEEIPDQGGTTPPAGDGDQGGSFDPAPDPTPNPDPDVPEQGGGSDPAPDPTPNPDPDEPEQGGGSDTPTQPGNGTLSTDDARDAFGSLYDNSDPTYNDLNREFFTGMVSGFFGSGNSNGGDTEPDPEEPDFDDSFDGDFGTEFNPDEYVPEEEPEDPEEEITDAQVENIIVNVAGTYYDNLQAGIQANQQANSGATTEEQQAARDEFVERESEAFAGLINVVTNPEETTGEQLVQSVDALINSDVCLDTVTQSTTNNPEFTETVQEATQNINEETISEIETKLNEAIATNPEKSQQYQDLANLFGITLGENGEISGDVVIPEGFN